MFEPTIQLLVWTNPDDDDDQQLVRAPLTFRGTYVDVENYATGERFTAHVADLTKPRPPEEP
jgi:hypothetical protein